MTGARLTTPPRFRPLPSALLLLACAVATVPAVAAGRAASAATVPSPAADSRGPSWASLSPSQHTALAPLAAEWNSLESIRKEKWLEIASRYPSMPAEEQQRVHLRMSEWTRLTPQQRTQARLNFQQSREVPKAEREARWEAYQALPAERKQALAQRAVPAAGAPSAAIGKPKAPTPVDAVQPKSNLVRNAASAPDGARPVTPVVVQARSGATTTLLSAKPAAPPPHQMVGQPKIAAGPGQVDRTTLLPRGGAQGIPQQAVNAPAKPKPVPPVAPVIVPARPVAPPTSGAVVARP